MPPLPSCCRCAINRRCAIHCHHLHCCHCHCCCCRHHCVAVVTSVVVASPTRHLLPLPSRRSVPVMSPLRISLPSLLFALSIAIVVVAVALTMRCCHCHCRCVFNCRRCCAAHCRRHRAAHCRCCRRVAITPSIAVIAIALPLHPNLVVVAVIVSMPSSLLRYCSHCGRPHHCGAGAAR